MRDTYLSYGHQWIDEADIEAVVEALKSDRITTGSKVEEFEEKVASYCGARYAVAVSSGTAALHAACVAVGISRGDEVITSPITFFATVSSIMMCGGVPILADVREDTVNIDPDEVERAVTEETKAVIPVDFAGHPADLDEIISIARDNGLIVIEDACHALGAEYKGKKIGRLSDMTVFSFHPVKVVTTGEGGMILTDSEEYCEKLRMFRNHNIKRVTPWRYEINEVGFNYRLTDIQCALGISQLKKLDSFIFRRREIARIYNEAFVDVEGVTTPIELESVKSSYHLYVIRVNANRDGVLEALAKENIGAQVHYVPVHYQPCLKGKYAKGDFPKAEAYYNCAISLPIFPKMADGDVQDVIDAVKKVVEGGRYEALA